MLQIDRPSSGAIRSQLDSVSHKRLPAYSSTGVIEGNDGVGVLILHNAEDVRLRNARQQRGERATRFAWLYRYCTGRCQENRTNPSGVSHRGVLQKSRI